MCSQELCFPSTLLLPSGLLSLPARTLPAQLHEHEASTGIYKKQVQAAVPNGLGLDPEPSHQLDLVRPAGSQVSREPEPLGPCEHMGPPGTRPPAPCGSCSDSLHRQGCGAGLCGLNAIVGYVPKGFSPSQAHRKRSTPAAVTIHWSARLCL